MAWYDALLPGRRKVKLTEPGTWVLETPTAAGKSVTAGTSLQLATAWACVRLISETIGTLPIGIYAKDASGARRALTDHPLYALLHDSPNADETAVEFWEGKAAGVALLGNGYAEKRYGSRGQLAAVQSLRSDLVTVTRNTAGAKVYTYNDRGKAEPLPEDKVFHVKGFGLGGDVGLSPVSYARETFGAALATEEAAAKIFANGLQQPLVIDSGQARLEPDQRNQLQELFRKFAGSSNAGKVMVLEQGMKPVPLSFNPEDAQMLETRGFHVEEICRWFRVPPFMVGHTEKVTSWGTGLEQQMIGFLTFTLQPYITRLEQAVEKQLLSAADRARGIYVEFNIEGLLRSDTQARAEYLSKKMQNGALMPNEWRAYDNQPPLPGGDRLFVNSTLVPIDQAGRVKTQPSPGEPV